MAPVVHRGLISMETALVFAAGCAAGCAVAACAFRGIPATEAGWKKALLHDPGQDEASTPPAGAPARSTVLSITSSHKGSDGNWRRPWHAPVGIEDPYLNYGNVTSLSMAMSELEQALGVDAVSQQYCELEQWGRSSDSTVNSCRLPDIVVYPSSTKQVTDVARIASRWLIPMVAVSGRTSLEGNSSAPHGGIAISFKRMNKVLEYHLDDQQVVVQPGLGWTELNDDQRLKDAGLFFPVDPGPRAQFGGMAGTNCSGTNAVRYGTMRNNVVNITFVTADGHRVTTRRRPCKTSAGYDLTQLLVGSEGTLGIFTEITLKLRPVPQETRVLAATFNDCTVAVNASLEVLRMGVDVQCIELMDSVQMAVFNKFLGNSARRWEESDTLLVKFSGTPAGVDEQAKITGDVFRKHGATTIAQAHDEAEAQDMWRARKSSLPAMKQQSRPGDKPWSTDVAVPPSKLPEIIRWAQQRMQGLTPLASILGHVGDGNFHCSIMHDPQADYAKVKQFNDDLVREALALDGTCTGEHGIGIGKMTALVDELGQTNLDLQRALKRAWDPNWLLSPGTIFEPTSDHAIQKYEH